MYKFIYLLFILSLNAYSSNLDNAYTLFFNNNIDSAISTLKSSSPTDSTEIANKERALSIIYRYIGDNTTAFNHLINSYKVDNDKKIFVANSSLFIQWAYSGNSQKKVINLFTDATEEGITAPFYREYLNRKYASLGNFKKAQKLKEDLGNCINWSYVGPFENSASSGYNKVYPPEKGFKDTTYQGKSAVVKWVNIKNDSYSPWVFLNKIIADKNSVYYFSTTISAPQTEKVYISLGVSGKFKLFHNNNLIVEEDKFRNTGINGYLFPIVLEKGINTFTIKLAFEDEDANFSFNLLDSSFNSAHYIPLSEVVNVDKKLSYDIPKSTTEMEANIISHIDSTQNGITHDLLLISLYRINSKYEKALELINTLIKKYPNSAYLYSIKANLLYSSKRATESNIAYKKSYNLCNQGIDSWKNELYEMIRSKRDNNQIKDFIENGTSFQKNTFDAYWVKAGIYQDQNNNSELMKVIDTIKTKFSTNENAIETIANLYKEAGDKKGIIKLYKKALKNDKSNFNLSVKLGDYYNYFGEHNKALTTYFDILKESPLEASVYFLIAKIYINNKDYSTAIPYVNRLIEMSPYTPIPYHLKAEIYNNLNNKDSLIKAYTDEYTYTDEKTYGWEEIYKIEHNKTWNQLTNYPSVDSIVKVATPWADSQINDPAVLLEYNSTIIRYPSKGIRKRVRFIANLKDRKSIEKWQKYSISGYSKGSTNILDAATIKKDGTLITADENNGDIVFKSLEPGDNIVIDYTTKVYNNAGLEYKVYGEEAFDVNIPIYHQKLSFVSPKDDSIPYKVFGNVNKKDSTGDIFKFVDFTVNKTEVDQVGKSFIPNNYPNSKKVTYSDICSWNDISMWYYHLTEQKGVVNNRLRAISDSIFHNCTNDYEKIKAVHDYVTKNIAYSYVPFRQSGWIPQSTSEILATKIGDCKDMALLGRTLLQYGGVKSNLVLVNTGIGYYIDHNFVGPNFDHAILSATYNDKTVYVDLTSNNSPLGVLPLMDQGAMALNVTLNNDSLFMLPIDKPEDRKIVRNITIDIDTNGNQQVTINSKKYGLYSASTYQSFKSKAYNNIKQDLEKSLRGEIADIKIDTVFFNTLDTIKDSISSTLTYKSSANFSSSGDFITYTPYIPNKIVSSDFPVIKGRKLPISLRSRYKSISNIKIDIDITFPKSWKLLSNSIDTTINVNDNVYAIKTENNGNKIHIERELTLNLHKIYDVDEFKNIHELLSNALIYDNIQFIFKAK